MPIKQIIEWELSFQRSEPHIGCSLNLHYIFIIFLVLGINKVTQHDKYLEVAQKAYFCQYIFSPPAFDTSHWG